MPSDPAEPPHPTRPTARAARWNPRRWSAAVAVLLAGWHYLMAISSVAEKSATFDEPAHLTAGTSYWQRLDYRLADCSSILPQRWMANPLWLGKPRLPDATDEAWRQARLFPTAARTFHDPGNDPEGLLRRGRRAAAIWGALTVLAAAGWAGDLWGWRGAWLTALLTAFCPTLLAHGPLATTDAALAFCWVAAGWMLFRTLRHLTVVNLLGLTMAVGGLLTSKTSGLLFLPVAGAAAVARCWWPRPWKIRLGPGTWLASGGGTRFRWLLGSTVMVAIGTFALIWALYGFRPATFSPAYADGSRPFYSWEDLSRAGSLPTRAGKWLGAHQWLPEAFLYGHLATLRESQKRSAFLAGQYRDTGWWYFFPLALLLKTPPTLFPILALAAWALAGRGPWRRPAVRWGVGLLAGLLAIYGAVSVTSRLNIGHRHLLPIYPCLYVLAGAACRPRIRRRPFATATLSFAAGAFVVSSLAARPHYLAYFSELVGGPAQGYRWLVDSSLDWGQDLPALRRWMEERGLPEPSTPVYLSYFGSDRPERFNLSVRPLPSIGAWSPTAPREWEWQPGWYALSATMLSGVYLSPFPGDWNPAREEDWQRLQQWRSRLTPAQLPILPAETWNQYERIRLARLGHYLRHRGQPPDDHAGHSILLFHLDSAELRQALYEPLPGIQAGSAETTRPNSAP